MTYGTPATRRTAIEHGYSRASFARGCWRGTPSASASHRKRGTNTTCLISPLMHQLHDGASARDIGDRLIDEISNHFGMKPDQKRERTLATDLAQWWRDATASDPE